MEQREGLVIGGYHKTWSVVDEKEICGITLYLLENEVYGDEAAYLIVDADLNVVKDDVFNGFYDMEGMKPYNVTISEVLTKTVMTWAENESEAEDAVVGRYNNEEIVLGSEDYNNSVEFIVSEAHLDC